eukprot:superscaffoldBa00001352_g10189
MPTEPKGSCQGTVTAGSWDSSGSHFGLIGSGQRTTVVVTGSHSGLPVKSNGSDGGRHKSNRSWVSFSISSRDSRKLSTLLYTSVMMRKMTLLER